MDKRLVVKANKLNESRYKLSVQEQRIILTMISMIKPGDVDFKPYNFRIKDFADMVGIKGHSTYSDIKNITRDLRKKGFTITEPDGDLQIGWVSSVKYYDNEGSLELSFDPKLKPYLLALKKEFTRYQIKNVIRLKSAYSVRIYELLKQYQAVGSRIFDLEDLRIVLGIPDEKLRPYSNFKLRVIEKAKEELINTDIIFTYEPIKAGRRVTGLHFTIKNNDSAVKQSYKNKKKEEPKENQLTLALQEKQTQKIHAQLDELQVSYPDLYKKIENQAKKRFSNKELKSPGAKLKILFKMGDLLPGFIQKKKIKL